MKRYTIEARTTHATHDYERRETYHAESREEAESIVEGIISDIRDMFPIWNIDEVAGADDALYVDYGDKLRKVITVL